MFRKIFKREKARVFLGTLAVVPRSDMKRHFDQWGLFKLEDLDNSLHQSLKELFSLPLAQNVKDPKNSDLVLDVIVPKFQSGDAMQLSFGDIVIPLMWRPKISFCSRLYYLKTGKTRATFSLTEKMKFGQYISRVFSWRTVISFKPLFDSKDMEYLLYQGCYKLLLNVRKVT